MSSYKLKCYLCDTEHDEKDSVTFCLKCDGPLETYLDYETISEKLNLYALKHAPISAMKYVAFYPIDNFKNIVSLEEGGTPLIHCKNLGAKLNLDRLYIKNEGLNPTGCFKDRGTMVEITKAKELGAKAICLASTGNMAASVAAYSSAAKIPCYILVPEGTPIGKLAQTLSYGARVIQIRGTYSQCASLAVEMAKRFGYFLAGDYTFRSEGQKSQGYEIVEQLYWKSPDYIVCPIGCGTNFHAIYKGVKELHQLGLINKLPKLIGVQTPGCNPIYKAFQANRKDFDICKQPNTVASAIAAGDPLDGEKILTDIYESEGLVVEVSDDALLKAQQEQARDEGIFSEPSGSLAYCAVKQLAQENFFKASDKIVCIATGNGLKDPKSPLKILPEPASLEPDFKEIERFIEQKLYAIRESGNEEKDKMIFSSTPQNQEEIAKVLKDEFDIEPNAKVIQLVFKNSQSFAEKGKSIRKADLQYIIEEALNEIYLENKVLEIEDFQVKTSLRSQAEAMVEGVAFGQVFSTQASGVGPVDAVIIAIKKATDSSDILSIKLTDYEVEIDSRGVDAAVEVKMTLEDKNGNKVIATTSSPDVIVASVKAFEKGFNILHAKTNDKN